MQGKTINGFTIRHLLGTGGMAEVWYAENKIGKKAAVKMLLPKLCQDENVTSRFYTEAKVMVELDHPNIRQVYDYGEIDGRPAIVMEYLEGDDLKTKMKRGQHFTDEELKHWWNQLVDALNYTHQKGIVHRDIKPGNIFVDRKGNIKLLDFGIAKVRESIGRTQTGQKLGTLMYMSPEQVLDSKHVDYRTDIYSLAVTFIHLITGKRPYDSDTSSDFEISEQIVYKPLDLSGVPDGWRNFLAPYLEKDPLRRSALRPIVETNGVDDEGTVVGDAPKKKELKNKPTPEKEPKTTDNNKVPIWIGSGIVVVAVVALLVLLLKPTPIDPDMQAYEACQTVADYRAYLNDYGRNAKQFAEAKQFVDTYVTDSMTDALQAQQAAEAEQKAQVEQAKKTELERQAKADAEEEEFVAKCLSVAACNQYLKQYPKGKYREKVDGIKSFLGYMEDMEEFAESGVTFVLFSPNSSLLHSREGLRKIVETAIEIDGVITVSTAISQSHKILAEKRCNTIKKELVEMGVSENRIVLMPIGGVKEIAAKYIDDADLVKVSVSSLY